MRDRGAAGESRRLSFFERLVLRPIPAAWRRSKLVALPVLALAVLIAAPGPTRAAGRRDVLPAFAACVNAIPSPVSPERPVARSCRLPDGKDKSLELVAEDSEDFVMLDIKMTSCPVNARLRLDQPKELPYVHLLALPRKPVSGVEDGRRLQSPHLWEFAWKTATDYLPEDDLVLAVNPRSHRTQDQLHVHATRFADGGREAFMAAKPLLVKGLDEVWAAAETLAAKEGAARGLGPGPDGTFLGTGRFGVAAARSSAGAGFGVLVALDESPEGRFSRRCGR